MPDPNPCFTDALANVPEEFRRLGDDRITFDANPRWPGRPWASRSM